MTSALRLICYLNILLKTHHFCEFVRELATSNLVPFVLILSFVLRSPPAVIALVTLIEPIAKVAVVSIDNSFLLVVKLKTFLFGDIKVSIFVLTQRI